RIAKGAGSWLFDGINFILWGEFETPPKLMTSVEVTQLAALGGASRVIPLPDEERLDLHDIPAQLTHDAISGTDSAGESDWWSELVRTALDLASDLSRDDVCPSIVVICDEPSFSVPECLEPLVEKKLAAMVTPDWLTDSVASFTVINPWYPPHAHP